MIVDARAVSRSFGSFTAVDRVDLVVEPGEIVGLLGANGAGKTTLIKMLLGLDAPTSGSVALFGERPHRDHRRSIGYVPQNLGLYADLTAAENLGFRAEVFHVDGVARDLDLDDAVPMRAVPLGQQRLVAFEAAIGHGPRLLVLDEPTSGVSPLSRSRLWDLVHEQADRGVGVLVSTHYMDEAEQADRLVVMSHGRVVASGSVADVIGVRSVVQVRGASWAACFAALDRPERLLRLAGAAVRVLGETPQVVSADLARAGVAAATEVVGATLEEVLVDLDAHTDPDAAER